MGVCENDEKSRIKSLNLVCGGRKGPRAGTFGVGSRNR